ncbi:unnamed protein product [Adineta ricciae]|uniref:Uncharacterized protein n=1 Tax=Adineta ricciae TaxID=249248 RepID=A0A814ZT82_ADIRI|nr:unnamed protein product [Adineta ricciae]CAF1443916.1 unnamed protein product [Adineta ricciae]
MRILLLVSLIILILMSIVNAQSVSGYGSKTRTGRNHFYRGRSTNFMRNVYQGPTTPLGYVTTAAILVLFLMALHHLWSNRLPIPSNEDYVKNSLVVVEGQNDCNPFLSGLWSSRYYQYDRFHGPFQLSLLFDSEKSKVTGNGIDDIGQFVVKGSYAINTNRLALVKTYPRQNHGHDVTIQVSWNSTQTQFEGKWFIKTKYSSDEGRFELQHEKH